ncbi:protein phosphatase 2C domain-containing protein [Streptomyces sp. Ag109_O5-10]|uniref:protein phosphatase 2C domain-containing protein n=1 Tax=Streptomyces sp. Ag109_O5-10 TaxID=1855349 RepID=UPI00210BBC8B|nr:protein phosphatase 2C domain-containing protein [Streptomyces sp. Ag109_O5-10]
MSQPGGRPTRHDDDWWGQLYDDSTEDTGPTAAPDSLDDRFASAKRTVGGRRGVTAEPDDEPLPPTVPAQRAPAAPAEGTGAAAQTWPWDVDDQEPPADDDPADLHPATRTDLPGPPAYAAQETRDAYAAQETPDVYAAEETRDVYAAEETRDVYAAEETRDVYAAEETRDVYAAEETRDVYAAEETRDVYAAEETPDVYAARDTPDVYAARETPDASAVLAVPAAASASSVDYVGSGPPTYDAEPTALPAADPDELDDLVSDTVLDGARYGACTLRAVSQRGDSARYRGEPRRDALLTARFGTGEQALVLVAMATGARATPGAHRAAAELCEWIARAVGRSHQRLTDDIQAARRGDLKSGLHRLTDRSLGKLRASAAEQGIAPEEYAASLRCLLLPAHPQCRTRVFFGVGEGGLFRLRGGEWQDIEPRVDTDAAGEPVLGFGSLPSETPAGDRLTMDLGIPTPPSPYEPAPEPPRAPFLFRASVARPGDALVMCTGGLAEPLRGEPALCAYLARRWSGRTPPGLAAFLADAQVRVKGYADDRTAAAVWEA